MKSKISKEVRTGLMDIFDEIVAERERQEENHPVVCERMVDKDVTQEALSQSVKYLKLKNDIAEQKGEANWLDVITEEIIEAVAEEDPEAQDAEFIQVAALCIRIVQINRKNRTQI